MDHRKRLAAFSLLATTFILIAPNALAQKQGNADPRDETAIHDYVLSMPRIQAYAAALKAAQAEGMDEKTFTADCGKLQDDDNMALVDKIKYLETSCPKMNSWIKQHGLTPREFVLIPMSLVTAGFAQVAVEQGGKPPAFINAANIQFLKEHKADLEALDLMGNKGDDTKEKPSDKDQ